VSTHSLSIDDVNLPKQTAASSARARPLSVEDRQSSIIEAVIPLLVRHGRDLTSKQIAEAAGVAEGTIFRAFGDKDTLLDAAIEKFLDPEPLRQDLRSIPYDLPLAEKVHRIVVLMMDRFGHVFPVMAAIGGPPAQRHDQRHFFAEIIAEVLAPELSTLNFSVERAAYVIRLITFAGSFPHRHEGVDFTARELTNIILYGIAGKPVPGSETAINNATSER